MFCKFMICLPCSLYSTNFYVLPFVASYFCMAICISCQLQAGGNEENILLKTSFKLFFDSKNIFYYIIKF